MKPIYGWITSLATLAFGVSIPAQTNAEFALLSTPLIQVINGHTDSSPRGILLSEYNYNETSARVSALQKVIGTVRVDGNYGAITRREHLKKLKSMKLPTNNVPSMPASQAYNIPADQSKRCPEWEPVFAQAGLEPVEVFSYLAWRESGCNPKAQNATWKNGVMTYHLNKDKSYDTGLLQINSSWKTVTENVCGKDASDNHMQGLKDPMCNIAVAKYIMDNSQGKLANWRIYKN